MPRSRLDALLTHVTSTAEDSLELSSIKQEVSITALKRSFTISPERLSELKTFMIYEMFQGLRGSPSTLKMLPTFVYRGDPTQTNGLVYALDLGGTNFRVIRMQLRDGELLSSNAQKFRIPPEHMTGTAEGLFGFIADSLLGFASRDGVTAISTGTIPIGFTFSFPIRKSSIDKGILVEWTKGFSTADVVGKDVIELLQTALHSRKSIISHRMKVVALCNDTVGTLIGRYFKDPHAMVGVIFGTGANVCYWERSRRVIGDKAAVKKSDVTVVNTELGNFDSDGLYVLPITTYDQAIDDASPNPGKQRFEKLISGMYLGEIARRILIALSQNGSLPVCFKLHLDKPYCFNSQDCSTISSDRLPGLHLTASVLRRRFSIECPSYADLRAVRDVCYLVIQRAAQLAGVAIAAALMKSESFGNATVAIDGSVFELTPYFKSILSGTINQLVPQHSDVRIVLQKSGSGFGAGFIAALAHSAAAPPAPTPSQ